VKKICMVCQSYYLRDPRVRREAEALADDGFAVDIITLRDKGELKKEEVNGVNIYRIPLLRKRRGIIRYLFEYFWFFFLASTFLAYLFIKKRYKLIQIHTMPDFLVFCALIPKMFKAKIILDVHEPMPELFTSKYNLGKKNFLKKILILQEKISFSFPHQIITVSDPLKGLFIERNISIDNRIDVVLNVPDTKIFKRMNIRKSRKPDNDFILIYTGTIAERNGLDIAIRGVDLLKNEIPKIKLLIVGEGEHLINIKNLVLELNLRNYVKFHDSVPIDQIPNFISGANLGISTHKQDSFWDYYFSTKIVEFLISDLPVVSARTKTIQHYFSDNELFFFTPESINDFVKKVSLIYENPALSKEKVANARKHISEYLNWEKEKSKYIKLIDFLNN
jgi:glycosyltransferase involved in cell wall biosynthesis